jgi:hypothetical protein
MPFFKNFMLLSSYVIIYAMVMFIAFSGVFINNSVSTRIILLKLGEAILSACPPAIFVVLNFSMIQGVARLQE